MKDEGEKKERKKIARDSFCAMKFSQEDGVREKGGKKTCRINLVINLRNVGYTFVAVYEQKWYLFFHGRWTNEHRSAKSRI